MNDSFIENYDAEQLAAVYKNAANFGDDDLFTFNGLIIPLPKTATLIGLNLSGGADSTALACLIATEIKRRGQNAKIVPVSYVRDHFTKPWEEQAYNRVITKLKDLFGEDMFAEPVMGFFPQPWEYVKSPIFMHRHYGAYLSHYALHRRRCDVVMSGKTSWPMANNFSFDADTYGGPEDRKTFTSHESVIGRDTGMFTPLSIVDKRWVIEVYKKLGLKDLLDITFSCTHYGDKAMFDQDTMGKMRRLGDDVTLEDLPKPNTLFFREFDMEDGVFEPCGECWWCKEREWARKQVDF